MTTTANLRLGLPGFEYRDLHDPDGLQRLHEAFGKELARADRALAERYEAWLAGGEVAARDESELLVEVARHVSAFLVRLFGIGEAVQAHRERVERKRRLFAFRKQFVARRAARRSPEDADTETLEAELERELGAPVEEQGLAEAVLERLERGAEDDPLLEAAERYVAACLRNGVHRSWTSLHLQGKVDWKRLVETVDGGQPAPGTMAGPVEHLRRRDGFTLTDDRGTLEQRLGQIDTCLFCHPRGVDSCRKGLPDKQGAIRKNPIGVPLNGCPLEERISEAHVLANEGDPIGSLGLVIIDNPMVPGTGHRICNDCMKACIFQNQEPVDIPRAETGTLTDVLDLPWGVEIYGLLTRWNPLNRRRPVARPYNGINVLVVGLGPAGYTLAHYLLNEGFGVVGIDGLKIEPWPAGLADAAAPCSGGTVPRPIRDFSSLTTPLDQRIPSGFGGVSEYGITVRWDKNFLRLIHLTLNRRARFRAYGGVRFGGTLELDDCWALGFHHVAMATGAGKPTIIDMKNNLTRGVRKASDFLMALQLTGAFQKDTLANLQVELPALVIGGGLTAVDTATELMAYYPVQVERYLARFERLVAEADEQTVLARLSAPERAIHERFVGHARALRAERETAAREGRRPDFVPLLRSWGGVTICYRKGMDQSPAYRLNHEEIIKAFEEGIYWLEGVTPLEAVDDEHDALQAVVFDRTRRDQDGRWRTQGETLTLPARSLFVAAGTSPNIIYEKEHEGTFQLDERGYFFQTFDAEGQHSRKGTFTSYRDGDRRVSFYGDNHPLYAGNVVKAMASARDGYAAVVDLFRERVERLDQGQQDERERDFDALVGRLDDQLRAVVVRVERLTPTIVDV
ncbi:MAG: FAD-dependent oxidoreductase, partial [Deltaproteobacteria bacterium]|nr:FAD-dependent oxidoreductase [Deltaproteobacteria bacterium]